MPVFLTKVWMSTQSANACLPDSGLDQHTISNACLPERELDQHTVCRCLYQHTVCRCLYQHTVCRCLYQHTVCRCLYQHTVCRCLYQHTVCRCLYQHTVCRCLYQHTVCRCLYQHTVCRCLYQHTVCRCLYQHTVSSACISTQSQVPVSAHNVQVLVLIPTAVDYRLEYSLQTPVSDSRLYQHTLCKYLSPPPPTSIPPSPLLPVPNKPCGFCGR